MRYVRPREYRLNPRDPVELLNGVVEYFGQRRRTFTEDEALHPLWDGGEEIRLREDPRFWELSGCNHFHLAHQRLANHLLADRLWQGVWDGTALDKTLDQLDEAAPGMFHVFCEVDPHLGRENGAYVLQARPRLQCPEDFARKLDAIGPELLKEHGTSPVPKTTGELLDMAARLDETIETSDDELDNMEAWLSSGEMWTEVARGLWLPPYLVPLPVEPKPFRLSAVRGAVSGIGEAEIEVFDASVELLPQPDRPSRVVLPDPPVERHPDAAVTWTQTLYTVHIDSGYLPVPIGARFRYPRFVGRICPLAIRGLLHETGQEGLLWLDRVHHRFYGDFLQSAIEWEEAGRRLQIRWGADVLAITQGEVDLAVQEEERRFVDPEALNSVRSGLGESYRQSLMQILKEHPDGLAFRPLYDALASRVHHRPSRASVRAVLTASPEFLVKGRNWIWVERGRARRRSTVLSQLGADPAAAVVDLTRLAQAASEHGLRLLGDNRKT